MIRSKYLPLLICIIGVPGIWSCSDEKNLMGGQQATVDHQSNQGGGGEASERVLEEKRLAKYDEVRSPDGEVTELPGFKVNDSDDRHENESLINITRSHPDEPVFSYTPPDGTEAEFSEPVMVTGTYLTSQYLSLTDSSVCSDNSVRYSKTIPVFSELPSGLDQYQIYFCIKIISSHVTKFVRSPNITVVVSTELTSPGNEGFGNGLSLTSTESSGTMSLGSGYFTSASEVDVFLSAMDAQQMYLTNNPGCETGGVWEPYSDQVSSWLLPDLEGQTTVYAKFKDIHGVEFDCVQSTVFRDTISPVAPQLVDDGKNTASSNNSPEISWSAANDSGSGVSAYEISLGSSAGSADVYSWTNMGSATRKNFTDLNLGWGNTYFANIRAVDKAGNKSPVASGNGFIYGYTEDSYIKALNNGASDEFGSAVAMDGDLLVVGSPMEDSSQTTVTTGQGSGSDDAMADSGAAYVYRKSGNSWVFEAFLKPSNTDPGDRFGWDLAISGDTIVVGSPSEDSNQKTLTNGSSSSSNNGATDSGAVYVFRKSGQSWIQEAYLKASDGGSSHAFGFAVDIDGDTIVVGAGGQDAWRGAAYVFTRSGVTWTQDEIITAVNRDGTDGFGYAVAVSGDTIVTSAIWEDSNQQSITNGPTASSDNSKSASGAVYIYKNNGSFWVQEAYIKASNSTANHLFGINVDIDNDTVIVGCQREGSNYSGIINGTGSAGGQFAEYSSGAVFVYKRTGVSWAQEAYIKSPNPEEDDLFGISTSIDGDTIVVGARGEDSYLSQISHGASASGDNSKTDSGAAYVFSRTGSTWAQRAFIKASNSDANDEFGGSFNGNNNKDNSAVSISGQTIAIGSHLEDSSQTTITPESSPDNSSTDSGAVYIFDL